MTMAGTPEEITVKVLLLDGGGWKVTTPDAPNYGRVVRTVQDLGLSVREAIGWARAPRVATERAEAVPVVEPDPAERGTETLVCTGCHKRWKRYMRNGRKPPYCDTCHAIYLPHIPRHPQEIT